MSSGDVALLVVAGVFAVLGIVWLVRMVLFLHRRGEDAPRALWFLVLERTVAWIVVGLAFGFGALGSSSVGHWLFLGGCALVVVEGFVWRALLPRLAAGRVFDDFR
jgi:hypothetical protein